MENSVIRNRIWIKMIFTLFFSIITGFVLMLGVYLLPVKPMTDNMQKCIDVLKNEGKYPLLIEGYKSTRLDNYTDAIMILTALYEGDETIVKKAMGNFRFTYENMNPVEALTSYLRGGQNTNNVCDYSRYWHGYLLMLKPVLLLFDYSDIRVFNMIIQGVLLIYIVLLMNRDRLLKGYVIPFIASIFVINPFTIACSMQYSSIYYIILISTIILIRNKEKFLEDKSRFLFFFMVIGCMTSFFDLLTWPLATCGFGLVLMLVITKENEMSVKIISFIKCTVSWGMGYVGMWVGDWLISSVVLDKNIFKDAMDEIIFRTSSNISRENVHLVSIKEVIRNQFFPIMKWPYVIFILLVVLYLCYKLFPNIKKEKFFQVVPLLCVGILPFIWFIFTKNHSFLHYTYTWRVLSVTIFAGLSMIVE